MGTKLFVDTELAWAAGYLDGEGHFQCAGSRSQIEAKSVKLQSLERLQLLFGGRISANGEDCFRWFVTGAKARAAAHAVLPFLCIKNFEAEALFLTSQYKPRTALGQQIREHAKVVRRSRHSREEEEYERRIAD